MFLAIFHQLKKNFCWKGKLLKGIVSRDEYILSEKNLFLSFICIVSCDSFKFFE
jgi:hypothetical protein